jgi:hypothetical protein
MKYTCLFVCFFLLSGITQAQETVWYCSDVASTGLKFIDGKYKKVSFELDRYTVHQDGLKFKFPKKGPYKFLGNIDCQFVWSNRPDFISCHKNAVTFVINIDTGKAGFSITDGWANVRELPISKADSMSVTAVECETF